MKFELTTSCFIFHWCATQMILLFFLAVGFYIWLLLYSASAFSSWGWSTPIHSDFLKIQVLYISIYSFCAALVLTALPSSARYSTIAEVFALLNKSERVPVMSSSLCSSSCDTLFRTAWYFWRVQIVIRWTPPHFCRTFAHLAVSCISWLFLLLACKGWFSPLNNFILLWSISHFYSSRRFTVPSTPVLSANLMPAPLTA